jgi:hypothetical protein
MHTQFLPFERRNQARRRRIRSAVACGILMIALCGTLHAAYTDDSPHPLLGGWDLTIPGGGAGWLGVTEKNGKLQASLLWGGGSVLPLGSAKIEGDQLVLTRGLGGQPAAIQVIAARATGDVLNLAVSEIKDGKSRPETAFIGKRTPPLPPPPDLSKVKFGDPIVLFNGKDLTGWRLTNPKQASGWSVQDGLLVNRVEQEKGKPHKAFGNLRTEREFGDFNLTLETRVPKNGNSGIYLRGIYEVQVFDSFGKPLDWHNMGAIYSRVAPTIAAEKPAGQWQTFDITLVDRHATVILNGKKIIDNQPLPGCTGGALWADQLRPGPIYLQGDHTGIEYRNIVLRPVVK